MPEALHIRTLHAVCHLHSSISTWEGGKFLYFTLIKHSPLAGAVGPTTPELPEAAMARKVSPFVFPRPTLTSPPTVLRIWCGRKESAAMPNTTQLPLLDTPASQTPRPVGRAPT